MNNHQNGPPVGYAGIGGDEAPPSYEDAMADEIGPVDGPRRDYSQNVGVEDRKDGDSGRLFP